MQSAKYRLALNGVHSNHALTPFSGKTNYFVFCWQDMCRNPTDRATTKKTRGFRAQGIDLEWSRSRKIIVPMGF